jgi:hypothetical protein
VATITALLSGVYIGVFTGRVDAQKQINPARLIWYLGSWNLLPLACIILLLIQYRVARYAARKLSACADEIIEDILSAASRSLIFPQMSKHIRAIVTVRVGNTGRRITRYEYNTEPDPERVASFPLFFGVTGRAYKSRSTVVLELTDEYKGEMDEQVRPLILPNLRTVMAAPLLESRDPQDEPLGVLAFDSVLTPNKLYFDRPEARSLAQAWADIIAKLLIVKEG